MSQCQCQHPPVVGRLRNARQRRLSVIWYHQLVSTEYQVCCLKSRDLAQWTLQQKWLFKFGCLVGQILDQSSQQTLRLLGRKGLESVSAHLSFTMCKFSSSNLHCKLKSMHSFTMCQFSSSNSHCKLKSMKVLSDLCLDKPSFLVTAQSDINQQPFCS